MAQPPGVASNKDTESHTRLYHHTTSMFPYSALDAVDSEAEDTPTWLPSRTARVGYVCTESCGRGKLVWLIIECISLAQHLLIGCVKIEVLSTLTQAKMLLLN